MSGANYTRFDSCSYIFLLLAACFFFSCVPSREEQYAKELAELKKLPPDKLNEKLCRELRSIRYVNSTVVRELLDAGADPNCNCTITHSTQTLLGLLFNDPGGTYTEEVTPVELCFQKDSVALLDFLVRHGGKLDSIRIYRTSGIEMWSYLFGKGFTKKDFRYLSKAAVEDSAHIQFLLDHGLGMNEPIDSNGTTIPMVCMHNKTGNDTLLLHYLVQKGADFRFGPKRSCCNYKRAPVFFATGKDQEDLFFFLMRHKAFFRDCYYENLTVMQDVINHSKNDSGYEQVKFLLDSGLSVNERYDTELSTLAYAIKGDNPKIMTLLLDKGAEWKQYTTWSGFRKEEPDPFEVCLDACATDCLKLLLERYPKRADRKKLIKWLEYDIKEHPQFAGSDPKCKVCLEILKEEK